MYFEYFNLLSSILILYVEEETDWLHKWIKPIEEAPIWMFIEKKNTFVAINQKSVYIMVF